jgi:predicted transcriptional regulator
VKIYRRSIFLEAVKTSKKKMNGRFFYTNQESKELLKELKPEIVEEILAK